MARAAATAQPAAEKDTRLFKISLPLFFESKNGGEVYTIFSNGAPPERSSSGTILALDESVERENRCER
jgi:hypothetical protein